MPTTGFSSVAPVPSRASPSCLFILASPVCKFLQCLIYALTQAGEGGRLLRLTCSAVLWGGGPTANKCHWRAWGVLAVYRLHWVCPHSRRLCFPSLHCSGSRFHWRGNIQSGPWVACIPRSKLLKFRLLGTPQRRGLSWACVLCPSQVRGAQATRCLGTTLSQVCGASYHLPGPSRLVSWVRSLPRVSSGGLISGCGPPGRGQPSRIPGRLG